MSCIVHAVVYSERRQICERNCHIALVLATESSNERPSPRLKKEINEKCAATRPALQWDR